jgi:hypothetical protein
MNPYMEAFDYFILGPYVNSLHTFTRVLLTLPVLQFVTGHDQAPRVPLSLFLSLAPTCILQMKSIPHP